jgi:DNA-binding MarR family transcriptional regulator
MVGRRNSGFRRRVLHTGPRPPARAATHLLAGFERHRFIERSTDPESRRRLLVSLSSGGRAFLDEYEPKVAAIESRMVGDLSVKDQDRLKTWLQQCRRALGDESDGSGSRG